MQAPGSFKSHGPFFIVERFGGVCWLPAFCTLPPRFSVLVAVDRLLVCAPVLPLLPWLDRAAAALRAAVAVLCSGAAAAAAGRCRRPAAVEAVVRRSRNSLPLAAAMGDERRPL